MDYVCHVNEGTFGPPPIIAPAQGRDAFHGAHAEPGESVDYVNTSIAAAWAITRLAD